ncbi:MAG: hypothetical protein U9R15_01435 [Chloroflexota bacterium]|nr:hypothetical protein [Chloroflexota bacterium]
MYECSTIRDLTYAKAILSEILGCRESDIWEVFRFCDIHGRCVIERAKVHIDTNPGMQWSFATFIEGVYMSVLHEIEDSIQVDQFLRLLDVQIDDEPDAWFAKIGGVADRGGASVNEAEIFADMCRYGVSFDRIEALKEAGQVIE